MESQNSSSFSPREFSRLIGLKAWSYEKAKQSRIVIVGCGGLGNPIARLIARLGIGKMILVDDDRVEVENLNRDGFEVCDVGKNKAEVLKEKLEGMFDEHPLEVTAIPENVFNVPSRVIESADLVITATDTMNSRIYVNDICVKAKVRMVDAGFTTDGLRGHVRIIIPGKTACLRCTYFELPPVEKTNLRDKVEIGKKTGYSISPAPTLTFLASLASMMVFNALFNLSRSPNYISANLANMKITSVELKPNPECDCKLNPNL